MFHNQKGTCAFPFPPEGRGSHAHIVMQTTELNRDQLQRVALETLMENKRLILNWGTGVGKSRPAINAMQAVLQENPKGKILLVVQETPHKENWNCLLYTSPSPRD